MINTTDVGIYASSSKPSPTLCPPVLKFLPSMSVENVIFTPKQHMGLEFIWHVLERKSLEQKIRNATITWPQSLGITNTNQTGIVHLGLRV